MQMHKKHIALATLALAAIAHPAHAQISSPPPAEASFTVSGYAVEGDNPLGEAQTQAALAPFVGQHVGIERLQQAATALETLLRENGYGFYRVVLPPQDIGGVIRLQMFRFTVGTVEIKGNQFFSNDNILRSLPQLATGSSPNTNALARDLALAATLAPSSALTGTRCRASASPRPNSWIRAALRYSTFSSGNARPSPDIESPMRSAGRIAMNAWYPV